jgi:hypothetical protein
VQAPLGCIAVAVEHKVVHFCRYHQSSSIQRPTRIARLQAGRLSQRQRQVSGGLVGL